MKFRITIDKTLTYAIFTVMLIVAVFPLFYTISSSFKTNMEILTKPANLLPEKFTLDNYIQALTSESFNVPMLLKNSLLYTAVNVFISVLAASMGGYVFARGRFPLKKAIFACFTSLMFIKMGGISIYPTFEVLRLVHLDRSLLALIVVHCFGVPVVNMYLVKGNIESLPYAIEEAAKIDGCSFANIFFKIVLPLIKPILVTISILSFQASWNEYLLPNIFTITKPEQRTLIVGLMALKSTGEAASSWSLMLAGASVAMFPVLVAFAIGNKHFVKGIAAGAVKG